MSEDTKGPRYDPGLTLPSAIDRNAALKASIRAALKKQTEDYSKWHAMQTQLAATRAEENRRYQARERNALAAALKASRADLTTPERRWVDAEMARQQDLGRRFFAAHADHTLRLYREAPKVSDGTASPEELERYYSEEERKARDLTLVKWCAEVDRVTAEESPRGDRVRAALRDLWSLALTTWQIEVESYPEEAAAGDLPFPEAPQIREALAGRGPFPRFAEALTLTEGSIDTTKVSGVEALVLWDGVLAAWREEVWAPAHALVVPSSSFRTPGALLSGADNLAMFFGRRLKGRQEPHAKGGRISSLLLQADRTQLELLAPNDLRLTEPTPGEIFQAFGSILGNREWRTLQACFCAAHEDEEAGAAPAGKFWLTPARLAALLGVPREGGGRGKLARVSKANVKVLDESVSNLRRVKGTATFKVRGKDLDLEFTDLVREDGVTLAEHGPRRGRRPAVLYRLNEALRGLMESRVVTLPKEALAAPVDPRTGKQVPPSKWDDAFKVFSLLAGHARTNAAKAKHDNPLPWARNLDALLADANLAGQGVPVRKVRAHGLERLDDLHRAGLVEFVVDGQGEEAMLRYNLPTVRPSIASIPGRRVVEALPSSSSAGKTKGRRSSSRGGKPTGRPPGRTGGA